MALTNEDIQAIAKLLQPIKEEIQEVREELQEVKRRGCSVQNQERITVA